VTDAPFDSFALVGAVLDGQYRVDSVAGEGSFGVVYKGWHLRFDQPIAIKALKLPETLGLDLQRSLLAKFHEEAKLSYMLAQQSLDIARSIGFGELTTPSGIWAPFLVLEWLEGISLAAELEERRAQGLRGRSLDEAIALLAPAARGLGYAHSKRVAHRDVKPANMFLVAGTSGGRTIKLLDFGIAKLLAEGTQAGSLAAQATAFTSFTPYYAAPEQFDPRMGVTGPWTDVYALCLVLTEVLTDRQTNSGDAMTLLKHATDPGQRPTPRAYGFDMTDEVHAVCARALAVDPKERFADATAFWEALVAASRVQPESVSLSAAARPAAPASLQDSATRTAAMPVQPRQTVRMGTPKPATTLPMAATGPRGAHGTLPMPIVPAPSTQRAAGRPQQPASPVESRAQLGSSGSGVAALGSSGSAVAAVGSSAAQDQQTAVVPRKSRGTILAACIIGAVLAALASALVALRLLAKL
jgi:serine/threonine-protein kinase